MIVHSNTKIGAAWGFGLEALVGKKQPNVSIHNAQSNVPLKAGLLD